MKLPFKSSLAIASAALITTACDQDVPQAGNAPFVICPNSLNMEIIHSQNDFAFTYLSLIPSDDDGNAIVSPLSLSMALSMAANGAEGETLEEIINATGFRNATLEDVNSQNSFLLHALPRVDPGTRLSLANSLWLHEEFPVNEQFQTSSQETYGAEIRRIDMYSTDAMNAINQWAATHTEGMIKNFLSSPPNVRVSIMNALYFKGTWAARFPKSGTEKRTFHNADGTMPKVPMMHDDTHPCTLISDEGITAISLPYGNKSFRMTLVLPPSGVTTEECATTLNAERWLNWQQKFSTSTTAVITMPKFDINTGNFPLPMMQTLGMKKAFTPVAEFGGISPKPLFINDIRQRVHIVVDEHGTEAAAVTDIGLETALPGAPHPEVTIDRPFIFIISESTSSSILFIGRINNL